jgi:hypothetical protein
MIFLFPIFGIIGDIYGMQVAFYLSAIFMGIFVIVFSLWQAYGPLTGQRIFDIMKQK